MSQSPPAAAAPPSSATVGMINKNAAVMLPPATLPPVSTARRKYSVFSIDSAPFTPSSSKTTSISSPRLDNLDFTRRSSSPNLRSVREDNRTSPSSDLSLTSSEVVSNYTIFNSKSLNPLLTTKTSLALDSCNAIHHTATGSRPKPLAGRDLEQHISKLISENAAIVQTFDPLCKRSFGRSRVPTSNGASNSRRYSEFSMPTSSSVGQSKLASALLGQTVSLSNAISAGISSTPSSTAGVPGSINMGTNGLVSFRSPIFNPGRKYSEGQLRMSRPDLNAAHHALFGSTPVAAQAFIAPSVAPFAGASLVRNLLSNRTPTIKVTPAALEHPDNPEGSIIKDLLLKCRQQREQHLQQQQQTPASMLRHGLPVQPQHSASVLNEMPLRKASYSLAFSSDFKSSNTPLCLSTSSISPASSFAASSSSKNAMPFSSISSIDPSVQFSDSFHPHSSSKPSLLTKPPFSLYSPSTSSIPSSSSAFPHLSTINTSANAFIPEMIRKSIDSEELSMLVYVCTICKIAFRNKQNLEIHQMHYCRQKAPTVQSETFKVTSHLGRNSFSPPQLGHILKQQFTTRPSVLNCSSDMSAAKKRKISEPVFPSSAAFLAGTGSFFSLADANSNASNTGTSGSIYYYGSADASAPTFTRKISVLQQPNKPAYMIHLKRPVFEYTLPEPLRHVAGQPTTLQPWHFSRIVQNDHRPLLLPPTTSHDGASALDIQLGSLTNSQLHIINDYMTNFDCKITIKGELLFPMLHEMFVSQSGNSKFRFQVNSNSTHLSPQKQIISVPDVRLKELKRLERLLDSEVESTDCKDRSDGSETVSLATNPCSLPANDQPKPTFRLISSQLESEVDFPPFSKCLQIQQYLDGQVYSYRALRQNTGVTFCCSFRPQPMFTEQKQMLSMYSNWQLFPPYDEAIKAHSVLLLHSYDSRSWKYGNFGTAFTNATDSAVKMIEPLSWLQRALKLERNSLKGQLRDYKRDFCEESSDLAEKLRRKKNRKTSEDRVSMQSGESFEDAGPLALPFTQLLGARANGSEEGRVRIFDGGFKCNAEYTYVRGRGRGKYVCGECGIRCKKPSMLRKHIRTHTDLRPYSCSHCAFAFKTKGNLTKHMKSKAHQKKCAELGIWPIPTAIDAGTQIDRAALALQEALERACNETLGDDGGGDEDEDDDDEEEEEEEEEEDEEDELATNQGNEHEEEGEENEQEGEDEEDEDNEEDRGKPIERLPLNAIRAGIGACAGYLGIGGGPNVASQPPLSFRMALKQFSKVALGCSSSTFSLSHSPNITMPLLGEIARVGSFDSSTTASAIEQFEDAEESEDTRDANSPFDERFESIRDNQTSATTLSQFVTTVASFGDERTCSSSTFDEHEIAKSLLCLSESCSPKLNSATSSAPLVQSVNTTKSHAVEPNSTAPKKRLLMDAQLDRNYMESSHARLSLHGFLPKMMRKSFADYSERSKPLHSKNGETENGEEEKEEGNQHFKCEQPIDLSGKLPSKAPSLAHHRFSLQEHLQNTIEKHEKILNQSFTYETAVKTAPQTTSNRINALKSSILVSNNYSGSVTLNQQQSSLSTISCSLKLPQTTTASLPSLTITPIIPPSIASTSSPALSINLLSKTPFPSSSSSSSSEISGTNNVSRHNMPNMTVTSVPASSAAPLPSSSRSVLDEESKINICSICNKTFSKVSQLRLHVNIHYFERPYRCECCSVSFRTNGHLQKHLRSISHLNRLNMNITFGRPSNDNPRPFKCADCKSAFRIHGHLAKHLRSKMHILKLECLGKLPFGIYAQMERNQIQLNELDTTDCETSLRCLMELAQRLYANGDLPTPFGENASEPPLSSHLDHLESNSPCESETEEEHLDTDAGQGETGHSLSPRMRLSSCESSSTVSSCPPQQTFHHQQRHPHHLYMQADVGKTLPHGHPLPKTTSAIGEDDETLSSESSSSSPLPKWSGSGPTVMLDGQEDTSSCFSTKLQPLTSPVLKSQISSSAENLRIVNHSRLPVASNNATSSITSTRSNTCSICSQVFKSAKFLQIHLYCDHQQGQSNTTAVAPAVVAIVPAVHKQPQSQQQQQNLSCSNESQEQRLFQTSTSVPLPVSSSLMQSGFHSQLLQLQQNQLFKDENNNLFPGFRLPNLDKSVQPLLISGVCLDCRTCGKHLNSPIQLHQHMLSHATFRPYVCEVCDAGFTSWKLLNSHLLIHIRQNAQPH